MQIILLALFLISAQICNTESIVTGDSVVETSISTNVNNGTTESSVTTKVEGNSEVQINVKSSTESSTDSNSTSKVYKKIETTVNGDTKTYESTESGEMRIDIVATASPIPPTITPPKIEVKTVKIQQPSQFMKILQNILRFFR